MKNTKLNNLDINVLTREQYETAKVNNELNEDALYMVKESDYSTDGFSQRVNTLENEINNLSVDYIVEQGTDGFWSYRKWNSGLAECWGMTPAESIAMSSTACGHYYTTKSKNLPENLFTSISFASICRTFGDTSNGLIATDINNYTTSNISYYIWYGNSSQTLSLSFSIIVKGSWK